MITVNIRKQGGAAVITIPSDVLKLLNIGVGSALELDISHGGFTARPTKPKRYTLKELLRGATPKNLKALQKIAAETQAGQPVGRELT